MHDDEALAVGETNVKEKESSKKKVLCRLTFFFSSGDDAASKQELLLRLSHPLPPKLQLLQLHPAPLLIFPLDTILASSRLRPRPPPMAPAPYVGQRASYTGALCTVRYIGPVEGTAGTWLGVEWDDARRGRHDGSHNGTRYFTCERRRRLVSLPPAHRFSQACQSRQRQPPSSVRRGRPTSRAASSPPSAINTSPTRPRARAAPPTCR